MIKSYKNRITEFSSIVVTLAFIIAAMSTFYKFVPVNEANWISSGTGKYVFVSCFFGIAFFILEKYCYAFFITIFNLFFVAHEPLVFYDAKAIELGKEIATETEPGFFRSAIDIYLNIIRNGSGAFYIFLGLFIAFLVISFCWVKKVHLDNLAAIPQNDEDSITTPNTTEEGEDKKLA